MLMRSALNKYEKRHRKHNIFFYETNMFTLKGGTYYVRFNNYITHNTYNGNSNFSVHSNRFCASVDGTRNRCCEFYMDCIT